MFGRSAVKTVTEFPWRRKKFVLFVGVPLAWASVALAFYWLTTVSEPFAQYGSSMQPALVPGDYIMSRENYYRTRPPVRGDLVIHTLPGKEPAWLVLMRVVGLPGERLQMKRGVLHIDGVPVGRVSLESRGNGGTVAGTGKSTQFMEVLPGGVSYEIAEAFGDNSLFDETPVFTVPAGHYFVMGDNRDNSADSRAYGVVPADHILHRPLFIYWSRHIGRIGTRVQ